MSKAAVPMEVALLPNTVNMVKKKEEKRISNPDRRMLLFRNPVNNAIKKMKMLQ